MFKPDTLGLISSHLKWMSFHRFSAVNFENGSCALKFRKKGTTALLFTLAASDVGDNFKDGIAIFSFSGTQLAIDEGYYEGELSVTYSSGSIETVFKVLDFFLRDDF